MVDRIKWEFGPADQAQPIKVVDRDGHMLISWRAGQPPTSGMFKLLNALTDLPEDDPATACEGPPNTS
ncbi:hypothetical protein [Amycolatopsis pittospori]|uniref:hypothetical protein n=1 Tax=Amycolatopsis pittospori TaxID=2749434 RepID=UPI0015F07EA2|nr:hypothetical protein [Amycolatopsis pittospori]